MSFLNLSMMIKRYLFGHSRVWSCTVRRTFSWTAIAEHEPPDDVGVIRSIDSFIVVYQRQELSCQRHQVRFDDSQTSWYLFKFSLWLRITDEHPEVLLHTVLNEGADGVVLLGDAADLSGESRLQSWSQR